MLKNYTQNKSFEISIRQTLAFFSKLKCLYYINNLIYNTSFDMLVLKFI